MDTDELIFAIQREAAWSDSSTLSEYDKHRWQKVEKAYREVVNAILENSRAGGMCPTFKINHKA